MALPDNISLPDDLKECILFHGHLCPGLVYGYLVAKEATQIFGLSRAKDEEVVAICENDSCAVDAIQVLLGTSVGKGNLTIKNYGKNAYTIFERSSKGAYRFSKKQYYEYKSNNKEEFNRLDKVIAKKRATERGILQHKLLKCTDLLSRPFSEIFETKKVTIPEPSLATIADSKPCAKCDEMTMSTKMIKTEDGKLFCIPCSIKERAQ